MSHFGCDKICRIFGGEVCHLLVATKFVTFLVATKFITFLVATKICHILVATKFVTFLVKTNFVPFLVATKIVAFLVAKQFVRLWWRQSMSHFGGDKVCHILVATKFATFW